MIISGRWPSTLFGVFRNAPDPWSNQLVYTGATLGLMRRLDLGSETSIGRLDVSGLYPWSRCPSGHVRRYEHTRDSR